MANNSLDSIFKIPELRNRIGFTLLLLVVFRIGALIPIPGIDVATINKLNATAGDSGALTAYLDFFSGGAFSRYSILMLGIMPYISAQIIMQVATIAFPALKRMLEEDGGRRKFHKMTRLGTIIVCLIQGMAFAKGALNLEGALIPGFSPVKFMIVAVISITAGALFLVWLGEQITQRGIGNGVSLVIFAGIVAQIPSSVIEMFSAIRNGSVNPVFLILALVMFAVIVAVVVFEQQGERKIPVNYAKRIVGRQMMQGQSSYIPFKINPSGVIPIIFASSILTFPLQILGPLATPGSALQKVLYALRPEGGLYNVLYALLIIFFAYFYTQVSLNPIEVSRQIRENGGVIPGVRSDQMEKYLQSIINRIVLPGALFLAGIALIPTFVVQLLGIPASVAYLMGGTSLLIIVGVDLDTMNQIESHLKMHQHSGLVAKGRISSRNI